MFIKLPSPTSKRSLLRRMTVQILYNRILFNFNLKIFHCQFVESRCNQRHSKKRCANKGILRRRHASARRASERGYPRQDSAHRCHRQRLRPPVFSRARGRARAKQSEPREYDFRIDHKNHKQLSSSLHSHITQTNLPELKTFLSNFIESVVVNIETVDLNICIWHLTDGGEPRSNKSTIRRKRLIRMFDRVA